MLRNRSREVTNKQAIATMTDHISVASPSPTQNQTSSVSSFLGSPRIFNGLLPRTVSEAEIAMSPTSILDTKSFSNFVINPFVQGSNNASLENKHTYEQVHGVGLAIIDSLSSDENDPHLSTDKQTSKMVLFGAKLKVQIPSLPSSSTLSPFATPKSPADFGIKTRNSLLLDPLSGFGSPIKAKNYSHELSEGLSLSEMELSEDYTCVITHGPNPKTTHIFDDCVVENCCGVVKLSDMGKGCGFSTHDPTSLPVNFLRVCDSCKDSLGHGKDIFMYRGEKAFCSHECRCQEMLVEEGLKNLEDEDDLMT